MSAAPTTPEALPVHPVYWCIHWIRDHYQDHPTIDGLLGAMLEAHNSLAAPPEAQQPAEQPGQADGGGVSERQTPVKHEARRRNRFNGEWSEWRECPADMAATVKAESVADEWEIRALYTTPPAPAQEGQQAVGPAVFSGFAQVIDGPGPAKLEWDDTPPAPTAPAQAEASEDLSAAPSPVTAWIAVDDQLPTAADDGSELLVWTWDGRTVEYDEWAEGFFQPAGPTVGGWVSEGWGFVCDSAMRQATHWMPRTLPRPPGALLESAASLVRATPKAEAVPSRYVTTPGESIAGIALRQLRDETRWPEIRDLNEDRFPGMGPHDYYPVGTVLKLPAPTDLAAELRECRQALERVTTNFRLILACKPVRDVAETLAECDAALRKKGGAA